MSRACYSIPATVRLHSGLGSRHTIKQAPSTRRWLAVAIMGVSSVLTNLGYFALYALFVSLAALSFKLVTGRMPEFAQPRRKRFRRAMVGAGGKGKKDTGDGTRAAPQDAKQE